MQIIGVLPEDAPDPRLELRERLRGLPFAVMGLVPQASLEDTDAFSVAESTDAAGRSQLSVSVTYTLWRNPADRDDPVNLAELDDQTRASLDNPPPWPRPTWLIEQAERLRHPMLWEVVRTTWNRDPSEYTTLQRQLVDHANHILMNRFREELGLPAGPIDDRDWEVKESSVNPEASLEVDGVNVPAFEIDTDPFVYAIGVGLLPNVAATVVIARDDLPFVNLALATRPLES